jgi:hypothetical protein
MYMAKPYHASIDLRQAWCLRQRGALLQYLTAYGNALLPYNQPVTTRQYYIIHTHYLR